MFLKSTTISKLLLEDQLNALTVGLLGEPLEGVLHGQQQLVGFSVSNFKYCDKKNRSRKQQLRPQKCSFL